MDRPMFGYVKRLFLSGKLTLDGLDKAVTKNWITQDQADKLLKAKEDR